jgi:hypothetical protein
MAPSSRYLRRSEASVYLESKWGIPCKASSLDKYAVIGGGPPFHKAGRFPLYSPEGLDAWALHRLGSQVQSTSEYQAA